MRAIIVGFVLVTVLSPVFAFAEYGLKLKEGQLTVYSKKKLIVNWADHYLYEIRGNYIALLDLNSIFSVYRQDGSTIVNQAQKIFQYYLRDQYIATLDTGKTFRIIRTDGTLVLSKAGVEETTGDETSLSYRIGSQWYSFKL